MINVFKIVFLGIIGFAGLVYFTAPQDKLNPIEENPKMNSPLSINTLPSHFEIVGESNYTRKEKFFDKKDDAYLIIANHDSFAILNDLDKYTNKKVLLVANISKTPWFIKKLAVNGKLEDLYKNSRIKIVNDSNGEVVNALRLNDITQTRYFTYKVNKLGLITKLSQGDVKLDALEKGISKDEKISILKKISSELN